MLFRSGDITAEENEAISKEFQAELEAIYAAVHNVEPESPNWQIPKTAEPLDNKTAITQLAVEKIAETRLRFQKDSASIQSYCHNYRSV